MQYRNASSFRNYHETRLAEVREWRDKAAELEKEIADIKSPMLFRYRYGDGDDVRERDVLSCSLSAYRILIEERPHYKSWMPSVRGDLVLVLSPADVVAREPSEVDRDL